VAAQSVWTILSRAAVHVKGSVRHAVVLACVTVSARPYFGGKFTREQWRAATFD